MRQETYEKYLNSVHKKMEAQYSKNNNNKDDAKIIETYLNLFKKIMNKSYAENDPILKEFDSSFIEEVSNRFKGTKLSALFATTHMVGKVQTMGTQADDIFELQLQEVLNTLSNNLGGSVQLATLSGQTPTNIDLSKEVSNEAKEVIDGMIQRSKNLAKAMDMDQSQSYTKPQARAGKVDLTVGQLTFSSQLRTEWDNFFSVIKNKNFSLKNYTTKTLHFGTSDPYKAFIGPLQAAGYTQAWADRLFVYSAHNYENQDSKASQHLYHLRYIYELSGAGLLGANSKVDYIIYNNPAPNGKISVASVNNLIYNTLQDTKPVQRAIYRGISFSANKL